MNMNEWLRFLAGVVVLTGTLLTYFVSPWWLLLLVFAGLNLIQSAFTKWCPAMWILGKCGSIKSVFACHKSIRIPCCFGKV